MQLDLASEMPILHNLINHAKRDKHSLHVPGHHQGRLVPKAFAEWLGRAYLLDATELPGLDNLHEAESCIADSQELARKHYQSDACFYSVNGSTACIMAALTATLTRPNQKVAVLNPPHLSAWRGFLLADALPVFGRTIWLPEERTCAAPTVATLAEICDRYDDIAAVYVTSPTYQGLMAEVKDIVNFAHQRGLPVIVDEAHGAHLGLISEFGLHSVAAGADVVIQSTHKTLPSLTQTAWVHLQGNRVSTQRLKAQMSFFQSTSPSYLLLASLDAAQAWLRHEGKATATSFYEARRAVIGAPESGRDALRQWIPFGNPIAGVSLAEWLNARGIYLEYADSFGALAMFSLGDDEASLLRYQQALDSWHGATDDLKKCHDEMELPQRVDGMWQSRGIRIGEMSPKTVDALSKEQISLRDAAHRVVARSLVPYPPGVALVWPGERLTVSDVQDLIAWHESGWALQGVNDKGEIEVVVE